MNPNTVVELRDAAIYHANDAFREASFKGHKGVQNLILSDVNLSVYPGEMVYLIGRVGSGKSSLLKTLYAELPLREGYGSVVGFDLRRIRRKDVPYLRRRMGIVFQDYRLLTDRNVFMNLHFVLRATGWRNELQIRSKIAEVLDMVSLHNKEYKMPYELSGGEQQRLAIARALLNDPQVILADEPTGNLDPAAADGLMPTAPMDRVARLRRTDVHSQHQQHPAISVPHATVQSGPRRRDRHAVDSWHLAKKSITFA